ncbi:IS3 family transposase [Luteococcus sp. H138]
MWIFLRSQGHDVARCTIERLYRAQGWQGATRRRRFKSMPSDGAPRPADLVDRGFWAARPNRLWVADFSYVPTWSGMVYVAFVIDVFSRQIVGWRAATRMTTDLVLDALEQALWSRKQQGITSFTGLVHHTDAGSQYVSFAVTQRLVEAGVDPSVGSNHDPYDNALAESTIGLFKAELIRTEGPWRSVEHVELDTALGRLLQHHPSPRGTRRPEPDAGRRPALPSTQAHRLSHQTKSPDMPGRFSQGGGC